MDILLTFVNELLKKTEQNIIDGTFYVIIKQFHNQIKTFKSTRKSI